MPVSTVFVFEFKIGDAKLGGNFVRSINIFLKILQPSQNIWTLFQICATSLALPIEIEEIGDTTAVPLLDVEYGSSCCWVTRNALLNFIVIKYNNHNIFQKLRDVRIFWGIFLGAILLEIFLGKFWGGYIHGNISRGYFWRLFLKFWT